METQKNALTHILELRPYERSSFMALDRAALQSLELTQTAHGRGKRGSLLEHTRPHADGDGRTAPARLD